MAVFKRITLFICVNLLVVLTISVVLNLLGVQPYLNRSGIDVKSLAIFCLIWGMGGATISLLLSKFLAKVAMGVEVISDTTSHPEERRLLELVRRLSKEAGLPAVPEVGIYRSPEVNAFATGASKRNSLVAVSTGLLQRMDLPEIEGVLAHEITHISNGDMVTMSLLQGIVNAFVMFLARILAFFIIRGGDREERQGLGLGYAALVFAFEMVFMLFGMLLVARFSRAREFRADRGGAQLAGRDKMIQALKRLQQVGSIKDPKQSSQSAFQALKISGSSNFIRLFATHPPLEERIANLENQRF